MWLTQPLICMETLLFYQDILMWTQLKVSGWNGEIGSGTSRQVPDPVGIHQLVKIKLCLVWREKNGIQSEPEVSDSMETFQKLITSAKWNPNRENSDARSPRRRGMKRVSIFHQSGGDLLTRPRKFS